MELSQEQKDALEEQKKQCIFCRIVREEIPAKKVYENDTVLAVLDINPLYKGHILVLPKEHYPIMPLIPHETFEHLFAVSQDLANSLKKGLLMTGSTIFIANGGVAGQMSQHFMYHIVPREEGDKVEVFNTEGTDDVDPSDDVSKALKQNLPIMMENHFKRNPAEWHNTKQPTITKEKVIEIIEQNPQIKKILQEDPQALVDQIPQNEPLQKLFSEVDIHEIIKHYNPNWQKTTVTDPKDSQSEEKQAVDTGSNEAPDSDDENTASSDRLEAIAEQATQVTKAKEEIPNQAKEDIHEVIDENPKVKHLIINDPKEFRKKVAEIPELQELFSEHDLDEVIAHYDVYRTIESSQKLKALIQQDPEGFKQKVAEIPELQELFKGYDLDKIIKYYNDMRDM
ncbi:MAG: HIT domain-containing protein [Candidatus Woesearchaeota archaeon]